MSDTRKPKRPTDVIVNAIRVAQIATGEAEEECVGEPVKPKKEAAVAYYLDPWTPRAEA